MSEAEWHDGDDPRVRKICGYQLRSHVAYQDGRNSEAPALVFADADYEIGDGRCGLHEDGKSANEPAIVYARIDSLVDALARIEALEAALTIDPWLLGYTGWKMHVDETLAYRRATGGGE